MRTNWCARLDGFAGRLPITDGVRNYTYDAQRRIDSISLLGTNPAKTYYAHNILGQRIFKTEALFGTPTADAKKLGWAYAYDASGTLMGEYGTGGAASSGSTQHIYLPTAAGPLPVAAVINGQHYAVHADHLNTPRRLTAANNQVVWQWAFSAFGQKPPTTADKRFTNASTKPSTGTTTAAAVTYNLRYPGQVYDAESKLHYNYHHSYDPQTGRFTQTDPIGLDGGWNRYGYVGGNPLGAVDPYGLRVNIVGDATTKAALQRAYDRVKSTKRGRKLCQKLENSRSRYTIRGDDLRDAYYDPTTKTINVDPNFHPLLATSEGMQPGPTDSNLGHEIGHATGARDDGPGDMNNINKNENPIRKELGYPPRIRY